MRPLDADLHVPARSERPLRLATPIHVAATLVCIVTTAAAVRAEAIDAREDASAARTDSSAGSVDASAASSQATAPTPTPAPAPAPRGPVDRTSEFEVAPGVRVLEWAATPALRNPTAIDVDLRGRVWVAEAVDYRRWDGRNPGFERPGGDRILVLEDTNGDGACDTTTVFAQDEDLVAPLGVCVLDENRVLVSCSPHAILYTDTNGDGKSDAKEIFLSGFGGHDHDHGLHSFVHGPDGRLWAAVGNAGPHLVTDRAGFRLRSGSVYRDGGRVPSENRPGLVSEDFRTWVGGLVLRVDLDGTNLTVIGHDFRNPYEVALDSFGRSFTADNDDDGNAACRALRVLEGGDHGYFSADGSRFWTADRRPGQSTIAAHWHQDDPGVAPAGTVNGAGGPTGTCVYESDVLGAQLDGALFDADAGQNRVWIHRPRASGAGTELVPDVLLAARMGAGAPERAHWFRPSDVAVAPDGSVFVADWYDPGVGGHAAGDREAAGRIFHLVPERGPLPVVPTDLLTNPERAFEAFANPNPSVRARAVRALRARGKPVVTELLAHLVPLRSPKLLARAVWVFAAPDAGGSAFATSGMRFPDPALRATLVRALRAYYGGAFPVLDDDLREVYTTLASDPDASVRAEVALTLRDVADVAARAWLVEIAKRYDGKDRWYLEAFGLGASDKEAALWPELVAAFDARDPLSWSPAFAGLAWRLHPIEAVPAWVARAGHEPLPLDERRRAIDALAFTRDRSAAEAMLALALSGPRDTRAYAAWWTRFRDGNDWAEWKLARELGGDDLDDADRVWSSGLVKRGSVTTRVDVTGAERVWLVVTNGTNGESCDWADWLEGRVETNDGAIPLASLEPTSATAAWGEVRVGKNCAGGPLVVDGTTYTDGIGTHAYSRIAYELPAGARALSVRAAVDDGGANQPSHASEVEFQIWIDGSARRARERAAARVLGAADASAEDVEAAARELASRRSGGWLLVQLAAEDKLSPAGREAAGRHVYSNPDPAVRAVATAHFPRHARAGEPLPPLSDLVARVASEGDPRRGQEVFFGVAAACSSCHAFHGRGGDVGPDLSAVRSKYKAQEILDAVLNPSAAIAFGYDAWIVATKDEDVLSGFVLADGASLVLKDTTGRRHVVPAGEVASKRKLATSLMPDDVSASLSARDLVDVTAFLLSDPTARGERGAPVELFDGRTLDGWTFVSERPDARAADTWSVVDGVLRCTGTPIGYVRTTSTWTDFELELDWRFDPAAGPGNSGVLLRVQSPDEVWPRSIEAQLHHRDAGDVWNIGEYPMVVDTTRTEGRRTVKLDGSSEKPLGEWNHYRIVLDGGNLELWVNGVLQNTARWCAEWPGAIALQSEGAVIEFRNVVVTPIRRKP